MKCKKCAKQLTCNYNECKPISFLKTKNYGIVNYINKKKEQKEKRKAIKEKQDYYKRYF